jgi:hypothetical protein
MMGLGALWNKLAGRDKAERVEEQLRNDGAEQPEPVEDYEGMKDDVAVEERYPGADRLDSDK